MSGFKNLDGILPEDEQAVQKILVGAKISAGLVDVLINTFEMPGAYTLADLKGKKAACEGALKAVDIQRNSMHKLVDALGAAIEQREKEESKNESDSNSQSTGTTETPEA